MSRNAISANPEHYIFKIFWGSMPPDPPRRPKKNFFSPPRGSKLFFRIDVPPKQKILGRTLISLPETLLHVTLKRRAGISVDIFACLLRYFRLSCKKLTIITGINFVVL